VIWLSKVLTKPALFPMGNPNEEITNTFTGKPRTFLYNQWMKGFSQTPFPPFS
jgi:hypothetical protein